MKQCTVSWNCWSWPPEIDAIKICSYNASRILERDAEFGSLQEGLSADILIVEGNPADNIADSRDVSAYTKRFKPDDVIELHIERDGQTMPVSVTLAPYPSRRRQKTP